MARNWQSGRQTGLGTLVDAYHEGVDRNRAIDKEKADNQAENSRWAFTNTKNYMRPKFDSNGFTTGFEDKQDTYDRNKPILEKMKPEYFRDPPAQTAQAPEAKTAQPQAPQAQDYTKAPGQELSPTGRPMGKTYDEPGRDPQSDGAIKPLLKDPKAAQQEAQLAHSAVQAGADRAAQGELEEKKLASGKTAIVGKGTSAVEYDQNDPGVSMGKNAKGVDQRRVNASKTVQTFDDGANVLGPAEASSTEMIPGAQKPESPAENPNQYNPDPYMMGRITDMATTPTPRASDQMISVSSLPPALLEGTGLEGFKGQIPSSLLKDILSGKTKLDIAKLKGPGAAAALSPEQVPFVQKVDQGMAPGDALAEAAAQGVPITKVFSDSLYKSMGGKARKDGQGAAQDRFDTTQNRIGKTAYMGIVGKAADQWKKGADEVMSATTFARNAKAMANSGNTAGMVGAIRNMLARASEEKGPLSVYDVKQFGGEEGWLEAGNQFLSRGMNEGMTPENIKLVNRLADIYIKAGAAKAKHMAKPIIGGLRARAAAYGMDPNEAASLFEQEMDMELGSALDEHLDKDTQQPPPPPKAGGKTGGAAPDPKARLEATLKAIEAQGYGPVQKRQVIKQAYDAFEKAGGKQ